MCQTVSWLVPAFIARSTCKPCESEKFTLHSSPPIAPFIKLEMIMHISKAECQFSEITSTKPPFFRPYTSSSREECGDTLQGEWVLIILDLWWKVHSGFFNEEEHAVVLFPPSQAHPCPCVQWFHSSTFPFQGSLDIDFHLPMGQVCENTRSAICYQSREKSRRLQVLQVPWWLSQARSHRRCSKVGMIWATRRAHRFLSTERCPNEPGKVRSDHGSRMG